MRSVCVAVGLTAVFVLSNISSCVAASADQRSGGTYASHTYTTASGPYSAQTSAPMSRAEAPVPSNCIRQACGKLWCWEMKNSGR